MHEFEPGDALGERYRVDRVLARGGMGVLVAATDLSLDRPVALKFLSGDALADDKARARFLREARLAAKLRSEHAVKILDIGSVPDQGPFIAMELLEGRDLKQHVRESGPLPVETATAYVLQACEAIADAHSHGIVHRDLKSRNLFLTRHVHGAPLVKVLDFGISKVALAKGQERDRDEVTLTGTGEIMGSTSYMPPEQLVSARDVDPTADIWSIAVVLYELVTGELPFRGDTPKAVAVEILGGKPRLDHLAARAPRELCDVIARCLDKAPSKRFRTIAQLAAALEPFAGAMAEGAARRVAGAASVPPPAPPAPRSDASLDPSESVATTVPAARGHARRPRWPAVVLLGLTAAVGLFALRPGAPADPAPPEPSAAASTEASTEAAPAPAAPAAEVSKPATEEPSAAPASAAPRATASAAQRARAQPAPPAATPRSPAAPAPPRVFIPAEPR